MEPQPSSHISLFVVFIILALGVGFFTGDYMNSSQSLPGEQIKVPSRDQIVKETLQEVFKDVLLNDTFSGTVVTIDPQNKSLAVTMGKVFGVDLPKAYQIKQVSLAEDTVITLRENKTYEAFQKEVTLAQKTKGAKAPLPYTEKVITLNEIEKGSTITFMILPKEGQTLLGTSFVATQIILQK